MWWFFVDLLLYVDDMLMIEKDMIDVKRVREMLKGEFEMKDLGAAKKVPDMEITRERAK